MNTNELKTLLQDLSEEPGLGAMDAAASDRIWARVSRRSSLTEQPSAVSAWGALLRLPSEITDMIARPVALASMLMVMVLGSWITSVNASLESLPGDALYGVKLASERAQLSLASSSTKAKLHGEFAARRVLEVEKLVQEESPQEEKEERIQTALKGFSKQVDGVKQVFEKTEDEQEAIELSRIIEQQTDGIEAVLDNKKVEEESSRGVITETVATTEKVDTAVVETLVQKSPDSEVSMRELERRYRTELQNVKARADLLEVRIDRLEEYTIAEGADLDLNFNTLRFKQSDLNLSESMNFAANGGYDRAFEILDAARAQLRGVTDQLIAVELQIVERKNQLEQEAAEEADAIDQAHADSEASHDVHDAPQESDTE